MKPTILLIPILLCSLLLTMGCEQETVPTQPVINATELTPMVTNRLMIYQTEWKKNRQLLLNKTDSIQTAMKPFVWIGCEWYHDIGNDTIYWRNGVDGVWRLLLDHSQTIWLAEKLYAYPASPGEKWVVPSDADTVRLVSYSEVVTVDAGYFDGCYRYRADRTDNKRITTVWFKPGIGKVQSESWEVVGVDTLTSTVKLKAYN